MLQNRFELVWRGCKIKKAIPAGTVDFVDLIKAFSQPLVTSLVVELALVIKNRLSKRPPNFVAHSLAGKLARSFFKIAPEFVITFLAASESDNRHRGRQLAIGRQVVQRGDELAVREIACGAEDHNGTRLRHSPGGKPFPERVWSWLISCPVHGVHRLHRFSQIG